MTFPVVVTGRKDEVKKSMQGKVERLIVGKVLKNSEESETYDEGKRNKRQL